MKLETQFDVGEMTYVIVQDKTGKHLVSGPSMIYEVVTETRQAPSILTSVTIATFYRVASVEGRHLQTDLFGERYVAQEVADRRNIHPGQRVRVERPEAERLASALMKWWKGGRHWMAWWDATWSVVERTTRPAFTDDDGEVVPEIILHRYTTIDTIKGTIKTTEGGRHVAVTLHDLRYVVKAARRQGTAHRDHLDECLCAEPTYEGEE